ncbi:hypothetical protein OIO90_004316 [Microbotryomycetes sp. JL221]|nr:hypothetical protein OIO90_004316 [Microbotryomycetes sp. JL221]
MDDSDYHIINLFQTGSYRASLSAYSALENPSPLLTLYAARSNLALIPPNINQAQTLLSNLDDQDFNVRAIKGLSLYLASIEDEQAKTQIVSDLEDVLAELGEQGLDESTDEGRFVRGTVATVFLLEQDEQRREEGVEILREAVELGQDQECLGILTHLYISLGLASRAQTLLSSPSITSFTSDSLLSQLLTARTSLATGPKQRYEQAFYVYEELRGMQGGREEGTLSGVCVSEATLGRWDEAVTATAQALELNPGHATSLANFIALARHYVPPRDATTEPLTVERAYATLQQVDPTHPFLLDLADKDALFDTAASKFGVQAA